jgi:nicotinate-nucleotide pyrophosphorylase (carboxylating)
MTVPPLSPVLYEDLVRRALAEDLGRGGDITSDAVVPAELPAAARIVSRGRGRIAGVDVAATAFRITDPSLEVDVEAPDGAEVGREDAILSIRGAARPILTAERTALNFLGRLSGIATLTGSFVEAVEGTGARIVCTRKTTPGLRALEKYAVRCGGGWNHRFGLDDAVLIKDNHLAAAGGVREALDRVRRAVGHTVMVELEVDTLEQLEEALEVGVDAVLLDNMSPAQLKRAVHMVDGRAVTEASGGVTLDTVRSIADTGVDLISVGALTHSAASLDLSLELTL